MDQRIPVTEDDLDRGARELAYRLTVLTYLRDVEDARSYALPERAHRISVLTTRLRKSLSLLDEALSE